MTPRLFRRSRRGRTLDLSAAAARGDLRLAFDDPAVRRRLVDGGHLHVDGPGRHAASSPVAREALPPTEGTES